MAHVHIKNDTDLKEVARDFEIFEFIQTLVIKYFDPEGVFMAQLNYVGYSNLTRILVYKKLIETQESLR